MIEPKHFSSAAKPKGTSDKTLEIHRDKLYLGYVKKYNEISEKLHEYSQGKKDLTAVGSPTYSELRGLKEGETFAANGVYLHEWYFSVLGGNGEPKGALADALKERYGSIENFLGYFKANGMVARGWAVLAWDTRRGALKVYTADAHNQGGVWGCLPILVLDVYEHAYFADYGADRSRYIDDYLAALDWGAANGFYEKASKVVL